jgi:hypothetical protein
MNAQDEGPGTQFSAELRGLARAAHTLLADEHRVLDRDLERLERLVSEASVNLSECFQSMSNELAIQEALLRAQSAGWEETGVSTDVQTLLSTTSQMNGSVVKAVIALQFGDIVRQLIRHLRQRVGETQRMVAAMESHLAGEPDGRSAAGTLAAVRACRAELDRTLDALGAGNPARQETMRGGDVTLF